MSGVEGLRPFVWEPNSKIKDQKAYILDTGAKFDSTTHNYLEKSEDGKSWIPMVDVLVDSKGRVYSFDPDAVLVQLADGSGQAVYVYDGTATVDADNNVLTSKGPQSPTKAD